MFGDFETKLTPTDNWELKFINIFKDITISDNENEYKKKNFIKLNKENDYSIEEKEDIRVEGNKKEEKLKYFVLSIKTDTYHIQIRSGSRISIEYLVYHATREDLIDVGRPLTFNPHLSNAISPFDEDKQKLNYQGFINLMIISLIVSHIRLMYENYIKYGWMFKFSGEFFMARNNLIVIGLTISLLASSILITYLLEILSTKLSYWVFHILLTANYAALLILPICFHWIVDVHPILGLYMLMEVCIVFLKLYSYSHFWNDVRKFSIKKKRLIKNDEKSLKLQGSIYKEIEEVIDNFPGNISLFDLVRFMFFPVLCYQYKFPRTPKIRWSHVLRYFIQFVISLLLLSFISIQYIVPLIQNAIPYIKDRNVMGILERLAKLAIPNVFSWILMFYAMFHCWLNLIAEITRFGDRVFYKEWWNSLYLDEYWRNWNLPTHYWLMRHIYNPLKRLKLGKITCSLIVFFISAVFHEYIVSGALGFVSTWAFWGMFLNLPIIVVQEFLKNSKLIDAQSQLLNVFFWFSFCFIGQPMCILIYYYNYYVQSTPIQA